MRGKKKKGKNKAKQQTKPERSAAFYYLQLYVVRSL